MLDYSRRLAKFTDGELVSLAPILGVPKGTRMRVGRTAPQAEWGEGGAMQYELLKKIPKKAFGNTRPIK